MSEQQIPAVVDIDAMATVMEHHAERLDAEAEPFFETAKQLMTSAQQAADQVMAEAKARAAKLLHDAQARADEETGKGLVKQAEATYWRGLATRERDAGAVNQTRPDQRPGDRATCKHCGCPIVWEYGEWGHPEVGSRRCEPENRDSFLAEPASAAGQNGAAR